MVSFEFLTLSESFGNPSPTNPVEVFKSAILDYCEGRVRLVPSLRILWLIITNAFSNLLNFNIPYVLPRAMFFLMAVSLREVETVSVAFSKTMQNLLCDMVLWALIVIVNAEVGKILGSGTKLELAPKILYYCMLIALGYSLFVYLPLVLYTKNILRVSTNLDPEVINLVQDINMQTFIPTMISNVNLAVAAYFQSMGYGKDIARWNIITTLFNTGFFVWTFYFLNWGLSAYIWTSLLVGFFQVVVSLGFYFHKIEPEFKIKTLRICPKHIGYLFVETVKNGTLEYLDFVDTQGLVMLSAIYLGPEENASITFALSILSSITLSTYPAIRLPFVVLTELLSEKHVDCFKSILWNCIIGVLIYTSLMASPFVIFTNFLAEKSFGGDLKATEFLKHQVFLTVVAGVLKNCIFFYLDILKCIKHRVFAISITILKTIAFVILGYLFMDLGIVNEGGIALLLSLSLTIGAQFVIFQIYFMFLNWKRIAESVEILH